MRIAVITVSDTRTKHTDESGDLLVQMLEESRHQLHSRDIIPDNVYVIRSVLSSLAVQNSVDAVIFTGGTGLTGRDITPEAVSPLLDKEIIGFGEAFRRLSYQQIGFPGLTSRCMAGLINGCIVFTLPGSKKACRTGWQELIEPALREGGAGCNLVSLKSRFLEHRETVANSDSNERK